MTDQLPALILQVTHTSFLITPGSTRETICTKSRWTVKLFFAGTFHMVSKHIVPTLA